MKKIHLIMICFVLSLCFSYPLPANSEPSDINNSASLNVNEVFRGKTGGELISFVAGDITGDGKEDIVAKIESSVGGDWTREIGHIFFIDGNGSLINNFSWDGTENSFRVDDIDGDGICEIILFTHEIVRVYNSTHEIWSKIISNGMRLEIADITEDPGKEIVILHGPISPRISILSNHNGETIRSFNVGDWEINFRYLYRDEKALFIVDSEDDEKLIFVSLVPEDNPEYYIYAYSVDGNLEWFFSEGQPLLGNPLFFKIGDFENDGNKETLIVAINSAFLMGNDGALEWDALNIGWHTTAIQTFDSTFFVSGTNLMVKIFRASDGNAFRIINIRNDHGKINAVSSCDYNNDGLQEILVISDQGFVVLDSQGQIILDEILGGEWILANSDGDYLLFSTDKEIFMVNDFGILNKIPVTIDNFPGVRLLQADLNGDTIDEILMHLGSLVAFNETGNSLWEFGLSTEIREGKLQTIELDNDFIDDAVYVYSADYYEPSTLLFVNGKTVGNILEAAFVTFADSNEKEIAVLFRYRGLALLDSSGTIIWHLDDADYRQLLCADITGDGLQEIIVTVGIFDNEVPSVKVYSHQGKLLSSIGSYWDPPTVALIGGEENQHFDLAILEPRSRYNYTLSCFSYDSELKWSHQLNRTDYDIHSVDLDLDGTLEIVIQYQNNEFIAFDGQGNILWESTEWTNPSEVNGFPLNDDIDSDGITEVIWVNQGPDEIEIHSSDVDQNLFLGNNGETWYAKIEDFNSDGFKEIIVIGGDDVKVLLLENGAYKINWEFKGFFQHQGFSFGLLPDMIATGNLLSGSSKQIFIPVLTNQGVQIIGYELVFPQNYNGVPFIPEFSTLIMLLIFLVATVVVIIYRKKLPKKRKS